MKKKKIMVFSVVAVMLFSNMGTIKSYATEQTTVSMEWSSEKMTEETDQLFNFESTETSGVNHAEDDARNDKIRASGTWRQYSNGKWRYIHTDGGYTINDWEKINGKWYYFDASGFMHTGWLQYSGSWYYFETNSSASDYGQMVTGWKQITVSGSKHWYYFNTDGKMKTGWLQYNSNWYFFNSDGEMVTGWLQYNSNWYFFNSDGEMVTGWLQYNSSWYYFKSDGTMKTGWLQYQDHWYYFAGSGKMTIGYRRVKGIDYYFNSDGQLVYDSSLVAAVYTKNYGSGNINTLPDGVIASSILSDDYVIEKHNNFNKASFTATETNMPISKLNKGIFFYSGHGYSNGSGMALGGGEDISPAELSNISMNNTKVAFFFCCYGATVDSSSNKSLVTAAIASGAKASFGYKVSSSTDGDRAVAQSILNSMIQGKTLAEAVQEVRSSLDYEPLRPANLVVAGNTAVRINDTYNLKDVEQLSIPNGFVETSSSNGIRVFKKYYNGLETTDKIVYNDNHMQYLVNRNVISSSSLSSIDFSLINQNRDTFMNSGEANQYTETKEYITTLGNHATVILVGSKVVDGMLCYDCIDLSTYEDVTNQVDLFSDVF